METQYFYTKPLKDEKVKMIVAEKNEAGQWKGFCPVCGSGSRYKEFLINLTTMIGQCAICHKNRELTRKPSNGDHPTSEVKTPEVHEPIEVKVSKTREGSDGNIFKDHWKNYHGVGLVPFPGSPNHRGPAVNWTDEKTEEPIQPTIEDYRKWERKFGKNNVWVLIGSHRVVLDPDGPLAEEFVKSLNLPDGPISKSGGKSRHRFFKVSEPIEFLKVKFADKDSLEVRTGPVGITVPPSIHPETKRAYRWEPEHSPWEIPFPEFPREVYDKIKARMPAPKMSRPCGENQESSWGRFDVERYLTDHGIDYRVKQRGDRIFYLLRQCLFTSEHGHGDAPGHAAIIQGVHDDILGFRCFHNACYEKTWKDVRDAISPGQTIYQYCANYQPDSEEPKNEKNQANEDPNRSNPIEEIHLTDMGNAIRFVRLHGNEARYCYPEQTWYHFDGKRWRPDKTGRLYAMGKDVVKVLLQEAMDEPDKDRRMRLESHAFKCEADSKIESMLKAARSSLPILPEEFDRDPWLFNCQNGTINLKTGILQPHDKNDFISRISPVALDFKASCPSWNKHLIKIMARNQNLIAFLQRWFGYCLTGMIDERCMAILYGLGANGKSVTVETISSIMGDYSQRTRTETILVKRDNSSSNDIAGLAGSRFVFCSEVGQDKRLDESLVKDLSGGDTLNARLLYREYFNFRPQFKINLSTNHRPIINGVDRAIWDRIRLIPFTVTIPEEDRKPTHEMTKIFQDEAEGILAWMVAGCLEWVGRGLQTPEEVKVATKTYRAEMDIVGDFLEDCCLQGDSESVTVKDLYLEYEAWAKREGMNDREIWKKATLTLRLKDRGFEQFRDSRNGTRCWNRLSIKRGGLTS